MEYCKLLLSLLLLTTKFIFTPQVNIKQSLDFFKLTRVANSAFRHMHWNKSFRMPHKCTVFSSHKFATLVSLKVSLGCTYLPLQLEGRKKKKNEAQKEDSKLAKTRNFPRRLTHSHFGRKKKGFFFSCVFVGNRPLFDCSSPLLFFFSLSFFTGPAGHQKKSFLYTN